MACKRKKLRTLNQVQTAYIRLSGFSDNPNPDTPDDPFARGLLEGKLLALEWIMWQTSSASLMQPYQSESEFHADPPTVLFD